MDKEPTLAEQIEADKANRVQEAAEAIKAACEAHSVQIIPVVTISAGNVQSELRIEAI